MHTHTNAKTLILKGYEERRYPSVNQACTEVKYKMPEKEDVVEDSDEEEGSFKKVLDWMESSMKNINKTENTMDVHSSKASSKLIKYLIGNNKMDQAIAFTSPVIFTIKRKKVGCIYCN